MLIAKHYSIGLRFASTGTSSMAIMKYGTTKQLMAMGISNKSAKNAIKAECKLATSLKKLAETFQAGHNRKPIAGILMCLYGCAPV